MVQFQGFKTKAEAKKLKAWKVEDLDNYEGGCTVVFAETRGKTKLVAQRTGTCEDAEFTRIRCCRMPDADHLYHGEPEMDWYDDEDRIFLVREHGWYCLDIDDTEYCESCPAREWCSGWENEQRWRECVNRKNERSINNEIN